MLFVSHNLDAIVRLCPECIWLDQGVVMETGPSAEVVDRYLTASIERIDRVTFSDTPELPANVAWVSVLNGGGEATSVLRHDEPFVVEVGVRSRARIEGLILAVSVRSRRGVLCWTSRPPTTRRSASKAAGLDVAQVTIRRSSTAVTTWWACGWERTSRRCPRSRRRCSCTWRGSRGRPDRALQLRLPWDVTRGEVPG